MELPESHRPYTDKYFLRARRILAAEGINPRATMQVFIRKGPGRVFGIGEAVEILRRYSDLERNGGTVHALPEGSSHAPLEPLLHIEGAVQDFIEFETMYLGVISSRTTEENDRVSPDPILVRERALRLRELAPDKDIMYFGARHWHWSLDAEISRAAVAGGCNACSTDAGAQAAGLAAGVGTIPHALVVVMAHIHGREHATRETALAFDRHIELAARRIALVDTFNREIDDTLDTARALGGKLYGVRLDTAGEVVAQGGEAFDGRTHWTGFGVTVASALKARRALDAAGFPGVRIVLSSGFGDPGKLKVFAEAEKRHGRFFDALGVGGLFASRQATADIVRIEGVALAKTGREYRENPRLVRVI